MEGTIGLSAEERREWLRGLRLIDDALFRSVLGPPDDGAEPDGGDNAPSGDDGAQDRKGGRLTSGKADGDRRAPVSASNATRATDAEKAYPTALECVEVVVRAATGRDDLRVVSFDPQADMKSLAGRSSVFDVRAIDAQGRRYDIEAQAGPPSKFTPLRARYHAAMLDSSALPEGADFEELPEALVIVISERDIAGKGGLLTRVRRRYDDGEPFPDGSVILYVNCSAADGTTLGRVAHDFLCADPDKMLVPELAARTRLFKETLGEEGDMRRQEWPYWSSNEIEQRLIERNYNNGYKDGCEMGLEQGIEQGRAATLAMAQRLRELGIGEAAIHDALSASQAALA